MGKYLITSDVRQFIINEKKITKESKFTKEENVGKGYYQPIAYITHFDSIFKYISEREIKSNDDINIIKKKLDQINTFVQALSKMLQKKKQSNKKVDDNSICITKKEYEELKHRDEFLSCLECAGVDNWGGYSDAISEMEEDEPEEDEENE